MGHDASKVLLGATGSSDKAGCDVYASDPATFGAGTACRLASTGLLSVTKSAGGWVGISLGKSLSDHKKTAVLRTGTQVPLLLEARPARGSVEILSYADLLTTTPDSVTVGATVFVAQAGAATPGDATFRAATSNAATATSLAAQINAHATAGALVFAEIDPGNSAVVLLTAKSNTAAGNSIALVYTDNSPTTVGASVSGATLTGGGSASDFVAIGAPVYISDSTGKGDDPSSAATVSNAIYVSEALTGVDEAGAEVACALVDMSGGL